MIRAAEISEDGIYRYALWRRWDELDIFPGRVCWIMLNPSAADAELDDPTIRRCIDFSKRWGFGGLVVVNLFALRATDPITLKQSPFDPVGPDNDEWILNQAGEAAAVVAAWGADPIARDRARWLQESLDKPLYCVGQNDHGEPKHPLYVPKNHALLPFGGVNDVAAL